MSFSAKRYLLSATMTAALLSAAAFATPAVARGDVSEPSLADTISTASLSGSFLAAQVAARDNDDDTAVAFYQRAVALDPENEELKQYLFLALTANGKIAEAVEVGRQLPEDGEAAGVVRLVIAVQAMRQKSWAKVGEMLGGAKGGELDRLIEQLLKAWAQVGAGETNKALDIVRAIKGADWANVIRDYHSGLIAAADGRDEEAISYFQAATQDRTAAAVLSETYLRALEGMIRAQARLGKYDDAQETLEFGLSLLSAHPPFLLLQKQLAEKAPIAPLITSGQQGGGEVFYNVGTAITRQGGTSLAQSYLQLADFLNPGSDVIVLSLAHVFEDQKNFDRSNGFYERIKEDSPYWRRARIEYALNLNDMDAVEKSEAIFNELIEEDPDDLVVYSTLGGVLSQHQQFTEAAAIYDRAVARLGEPQRQDWNLFYRRGIAYERLKEWDKAEPNFKKALELNPDQPNVLNYLGYSWIDMGINLEEGMEMIRKAVDLKPDSGYIVDSLGWANYKLGNYEEAVTDLERAVDLMPQDPVVNDHLGDAYWRVGRRLEATFQWNHALANKPEPEDEAKIRAKLEKGLPDKPATTTAAD